MKVNQKVIFVLTLWSYMPTLCFLYLLVFGNLWWLLVLWFSMREKITKYLFFPLKLKWNTKLFWFYLQQSQFDVWLNQIAAAVNKSNKAWCFTSASLGNINILLFFDAPMVEAPYTACCFCSYCCWFSAFSSNSSGCCCLLRGATNFDWMGPGEQS